MSIKNSILILVFATMVPSLSLSQTGGGFPTATDYDPKAPAPANLPAKLDLPPFTRMTVKVHRQVALNPVSLADQNRLLWNPDLLDAVFESDGTRIHAVYHWEGGRSSEGYQVKHVAFHLASFKYPNSIIAAPGSLGFFLNRQIYMSEGSSWGGNFPDTYWYSRNCYAGTAQFQGNRVLVFTPEPSSTQGNSSLPPPPVLYLDAQTLLPAMAESASFIYLFDYTPDPGLIISPSGNYLRAIQKRFGMRYDSNP